MTPVPGGGRPSRLPRVGGEPAQAYACACVCVSSRQSRDAVQPLASIRAASAGRVSSKTGAP